jgi:hypothetical protein
MIEAVMVLAEIKVKCVVGEELTFFRYNKTSLHAE